MGDETATCMFYRELPLRILIHDATVIYQLFHVRTPYQTEEWLALCLDLGVFRVKFLKILPIIKQYTLVCVFLTTSQIHSRICICFKRLFAKL